MSLGCFTARPELQGRRPLLPQHPLFPASPKSLPAMNDWRFWIWEARSGHPTTHPPPNHGVYNWLRLARVHGHENYRTGSRRPPTGTATTPHWYHHIFLASSQTPHTRQNGPGCGRWGSSSSSKIYTPYQVDKTWDLVSCPLQQGSRILPRIKTSDLLIPLRPSCPRFPG